MESRAWVTFTVIGAPGVHATVLAAPVVDLALINILAGLAVVLQLLTRRTLAVEAADGVATQSLTTAVSLLTLIYIILATGPIEASRTITELGAGAGSLSTLAPVEAHAVAAHRIQAASLSVELRPSRTALVNRLVVLSVDLSVCCVIRCPSLVSHTPVLS